MIRRTAARLSSMVSIVALVAACVMSEGEPPSPPATDPEPTVGSAPAPSATHAGTALDSIDGLIDAVVHIEVAERYRHPEVGWVDGSSGSGFIIDPSGIALTNHHVVGEADTVTVWLGEDRTEFQADVVAVSECSDLAVIELSGGDRFAWIDWYDGPIDVGLPIYAAGFPLGEPEFTLTGGIVSRARGVIAEDWAAVQKSFEHDANILGGSSGGPVITAEGRVVGVNYATSDESRRSIGISRDEILPILDTLRAGRPVTALGIDGTAVTSDDENGIWVQAVRADSPAAKAGLQAGDIITELDGQALAQDATMAEYCDVLRDHEPDDRLTFTIDRPDSGEQLSAEFNGSPLEPGFAFATTVAGDELSDAAVPDFITYQSAFDDDLQVTFEAPPDWQAVEDHAWRFGGQEVGSGVLATTDVDAFRGGWVTPGVYVGASHTLGAATSVEAILDADRPTFLKSCTLAGRETFQRGGFEGAYDLWERCGATDSRFLTIAGTHESGSPMIYLQFQSPEPTDLFALDRILTTLQVEPIEA
jgi:serine protease Do